ncbi:hypothetical protein [Parabacteroides distasonis]|uniref:hypothetical protein n=1 Tax=Parabacteroides distasonis TaxID=823 RepID=UPI0021C68699|nr:hypothetical protein [Parabacteroides distasonis]
MAAVPTLGTLLNAQTIWLPAIMILAIFICPPCYRPVCQLIPVTQVFRVSTSGKQGWGSGSLLFPVWGNWRLSITLLVIVLLQYDRPNE